MPKLNKKFEAFVMLNTEKGGAWQANVQVSYLDEMGERVYTTEAVTAWKNASAAKRWIKKMVQELTPRKSVKLQAFLFDSNEKPTGLRGELEYKER